MESLFDKDRTEGPPPSNLDRIAGEIAHLKKGSSVRHAAGPQRMKLASWVLILVILGLVGLYVMDPFLYALHRSDSINTYLYLHNYDSASSTQALVATGILTEDEIAQLNKRQGSFQEYFDSPQAAEAKAAAIVHFMDGLENLHANNYNKLDTLGKIRCVIFVRSGLIPPSSWSELNSPIQ